MNTTIKLGVLIDKDSGARRDAVHILILPVTAGQDLNAGDKISINSYGKAVTTFTKALGIVDPFRQHPQKVKITNPPRVVASLQIP